MNAVIGILLLVLIVWSAPAQESVDKNAQSDVKELHRGNLVEYYEAMMKMNQRTFLLQQIRTGLTTIMVIVIVGVGLWLSYLQFRRDKEGASASVTTLKFGAGEVEVRSAVIGVVILALSLWFFQVYVVNVYAIRTAEETTAPTGVVMVENPLPPLSTYMNESEGQQ